jgi:hypothetical protein
MTQKELTERVEKITADCWDYQLQTVRVTGRLLCLIEALRDRGEVELLELMEKKWVELTRPAVVCGGDGEKEKVEVRGEGEFGRSEGNEVVEGGD